MFIFQKGMFWNKKKDEEPQISERISSLSAKIARIEAEILDLYTANDIIRKKLIGRLRRNVEKDEEEDKADSINGMFPKSEALNKLNPFA